MQDTYVEDARPYVEDVEVSGHIIDSLILPKVLDHITSAGGSFQIKQIAIGHSRADPSYALVQVRAASVERLSEILAQIKDHGAVAVADQDCRLEPAEVDGAFPEGFYSTTNQRTEIRLNGQWHPVGDQEMDCGIAVVADPVHARCVAMNEISSGESVVIGHVGVRVFPEERATSQTQGFEFMSSAVSTEKPKGVAIRQIARRLSDVRKSGGKTVLVAGPAVVHTGSGSYVCQLIRNGYINLLFAGNALAAHDVEQAMFGTSLGVHLSRGDIVEAGHEHHLRAINRIRRMGSIAEAVRQGVVTSGIMYECIQRDVPFLLAGSIRDDGPLPEVVTDVLQAQQRMRELLRDVKFCLMIATTLHSIAVGNLLPAWVHVACVDINPSTVIKLSDRGSFQTVGLVTDVEPFLRSLVHDLELLEAGELS